ncbi:MAG: hydrogen peroxide-inducible genes activator [Bauldia sp.]|nr:hydrogen peroxide-inducible genes activator [Bauldia sp.]
MITTRQLRYFDALVRTGHFGRAAEEVGVSQPALSIQIRELEAALGGPLVDRGTTAHRLTPLGAEVAARAAGILTALRNLEDLAFVRGEVLTGPLSLGIIPTIAPYLLPRLMPVLAEHHPRLRLLLREAVTATVVDELKAGKLDAVVASLPLNEPEFDEAPAFVDRFLLAAPAGSPMAEAGEVSPGEVRAGDLLLLEDGHCLRDQALAVCGMIDPRRLRTFGATSLATILQLVAAGQGVTLLPEMAIDPGLRADRRLALVEFTQPQPGRTIGVAWRKGSPRDADFRALAAAITAAA